MKVSKTKLQQIIKGEYKGLDLSYPPELEDQINKFTEDTSKFSKDRSVEEIAAFKDRLAKFSKFRNEAIQDFTTNN